MNLHGEGACERLGLLGKVLEHLEAFPLRGSWVRPCSGAASLAGGGEEGQGKGGEGEPWLVH